MRCWSLKSDWHRFQWITKLKMWWNYELAGIITTLGGERWQGGWVSMSMHMAVRKASTTILLRNRGLRFGSKISISESKRKKKLEKNKTSSEQYQILLNTSKSSLKQCTSNYNWYFHFLRIRHINRIGN